MVSEFKKGLNKQRSESGLFALMQKGVNVPKDKYTMKLNKNKQSL